MESIIDSRNSKVEKVLVVGGTEKNMSFCSFYKETA